MSYSVSTLNNLLVNAQFGIALTASEVTALQTAAASNASGALSDAQTLQTVLDLAESTTDVALATYQFFTGSAPSFGGLGYLVHGTTNPNDLSSAYYTAFNTENRFYNFAINLATGQGAGAASFAAIYSGLSFADAVKTAYEKIVSTAVVGAANAAAAIAYITGEQSFFAAVASERASNVPQDIAIKALMVGFILEEAIKGHVGAYYAAINSFETQMATGLTPAYGQDLIATYPAPSAYTTTALTTGSDIISAGSGNIIYAATIGGSGATLNSADVIQGGTGHSILSITDQTSTSLASSNMPGGLTVNNIETVNLTAALDAWISTATAFTGVKVLNVTSGGAAYVAAGSSTQISVTNNSASATTTIDGGSSQSVISNGKGTVLSGVSTATTGAISIYSGGAVGAQGGSTETVVAAGEIELGSGVAATGAVQVTDTAQGAGSISVDGLAAITLATQTSIVGTMLAAGNVVVGGYATTVGASTGPISVTETLSATSSGVTGSTLTGGQIAVTGGSSVSISVIDQSLQSAPTDTGLAQVVNGAIAVNGLSKTKSVSVTQGAGPNITDGAVSIYDVNATTSTSTASITTVSLTNFGASAIKDSALTTLSLGGAKSGSVTVSAGLTAQTSTALDLTVSGYAAGSSLSIQSYTSLAIHAVGAASNFAVQDASLTTVVIDGTQALRLDISGATHIASVNASANTGGLTLTTGGQTAETINGSTTAANILTAGGGSGTADTLIGGAGADTLTANSGADTLSGKGGADLFIIATPGSAAGVFTTITDAAAGDMIRVAAHGAVTFTPTAISSAGLTLQGAESALVNSLGDASANGKLGWFSLGGDTYLVESNHNAATTAGFQASTDIVIKLAGAIDLSHATLTAATLTLG